MLIRNETALPDKRARHYVCTLTLMENHQERFGVQPKELEQSIKPQISKQPAQKATTDQGK